MILICALYSTAPPYRPIIDMRFELLVVNNQSGEALSGIAVSINDKLKLVTNRTGFISYQYRARLPEIFNVSVAAQLDFNALPPKECVGFEHIRLEPKTRAVETIKFTVIDEINKKPLVSTCFVTVRGKFEQIYASDKTGQFVLTSGQADITDSVQVSIRWAEYWAPYDNVTIAVKNLTVNNVIQALRRDTKRMVLGIIIVDKQSRRRLPNVPISFSARSSNGTVVTDQKGAVTIQSGQGNQLWYGDWVTYTIKADGYKILEKKMAFPGLPVWVTWELEK